MPVTEYVHVAENALDTAPHTRSAPRAGSPGEGEPPPGQPACDGCPAAMARYEATGDAVVCVCGRVYAADDFRWPARPVAPPTSPRSARIVRPRSFVAPDDATPAPALSPLARAGAAALALVPDDPELARVRLVLADLRLDCPDPLEPPVDAPPSAPAVAPGCSDTNCSNAAT